VVEFLKPVADKNSQQNRHQAILRFELLSLLSPKEQAFLISA
jgi:hypothetical protein